MNVKYEHDIVEQEILCKCDQCGITYTFIMHIQPWKYTSDKTSLNLLLQKLLVDMIYLFSCMQSPHEDSLIG